MSTKTNISWVKNPDGSQGMTWNPIVGCTPKSAGCENCYAAATAFRFKNSIPHYANVTTADGKWSGKIAVPERKLGKLKKMRKPRMIFVNSMSDLFHESLGKSIRPGSVYDNIFGEMIEADQHCFVILTKRAENMRDVMNEVYSLKKREEPYENLWLGVSVENQKAADERIQKLLETNAAVRVLSIEPLLEPVTIARWIKYGGIHWVIIGSESGPGARPMENEWAMDLINECRRAGVPVFMKQVSGRKEIPLHMNIRQFPKVYEEENGCFGCKDASVSDLHLDADIQWLNEAQAVQDVRELMPDAKHIRKHVKPKLKIHTNLGGIQPDVHYYMGYMARSDERHKNEKDKFIRAHIGRPKALRDFRHGYNSA